MNKSHLALISYQFLLIVLFPILLLALIIRSTSQKAYRQRLSERIGLVNLSFKKGGIVIHAASVGEVLAVRPFVDAAIKKFPDLPITVTTFTPTGSEQVEALFGSKVQHCYLPLDVSFCVNTFLKRLKPKAIVLMETELWPSLINQASKQGVKLQLINARLSLKSLKSYQKFSPLVVPTLNCFSHIHAQSHENELHFLTLGAKPEKISVDGNLKYDITASPSVNEKINELSEQVRGERKIMVFGSTHPGDEELALACYQAIKSNHPELLLIIVPRHPERFDKVAELIKSSQSIARRSNLDSVDENTDVWLIDTLGELLAVYALADVCVVAGSFSDKGGHNPLEPALFAKPVIVGHDMEHFEQITNIMLNSQALIQLSDVNELTATINNLLSDSQRTTRLGNNARHVIESNQGATQQSINSLTNLLPNQ